MIAEADAHRPTIQYESYVWIHSEPKQFEKRGFTCLRSTRHLPTKAPDMHGICTACSPRKHPIAAHILKDTTCPDAETPLSVRAVRWNPICAVATTCDKRPLADLIARRRDSPEPPPAAVRRVGMARLAQQGG
jgi:hypothetical protein